MEREPINRDELQLRIQLLEAQQKSALIALENGAEGLAESLHPLNLFKSSLKKAGTFDGILNLLKDTLLSAGSGFVSSKIFGRQSGRPLRKIIGSAAVLGVTNLMMKNPAIISAGIDFITKLIKKSSAKKDSDSEE